MTPLELYQEDLKEPGFTADAAQAEAVEALQALYDELLARRPVSTGLVDKFKAAFGGKKDVPMIKGLYFWGGVGRGKTYLMDTFFESLPFERKLRAHFHRFMHRVHGELKSRPGEKNPLESIAAQIADEAEVICFDEFFVSDIADAMILGGLFQHLFKRGVVLVATSNIVPERLYENGLQRDRFIPAIKLIQERCRVLNVDGGIDYRLRSLEKAELYHFPLDDAAEDSLMASFTALAPMMHPDGADQMLEIEGRHIHAEHVADDVAWFEFKELCDGPRSATDYIEIAREFHAVLLANVPQMGVTRDDQARRFISLVDEFYDRNVKLVMSAAVPLAELYAGGRLEFEFQRTISRLQEMQSHAYLERAHKP